jgi:hypothetical protein
VTEPNQPRGRDRQIIRFVTESAWAIRKSNLVAICDLVARHSNGVDATAEQIAEALAANAARPRTPSPRRVAASPSSRSAAPIVPHADVMTEMSGGTSVDGFLEQLNAALDDDQVGHIVLDIDSPGGAVDRIPEAAAQIRAGRAKKPITAIANTTAASAAYWLAAQASELVVTPSGQVGSIGVYAAHDDISGMQEKTRRQDDARLRRRPQDGRVAVRAALRRGARVDPGPRRRLLPDVRRRRREGPRRHRRRGRGVLRAGRDAAWPPTRSGGDGRPGCDGGGHDPGGARQRPGTHPRPRRTGAASASQSSS